MRTTLPCALALSLAASTASAACDPAAAGPVVERCLAVIQSPADCTRELARLLDTAEDAVRDGLASPSTPSQVEFERAFTRRISGRFARLRELDDGWVADIRRTNGNRRQSFPRHWRTGAAPARTAPRCWTARAI